MAAIPDTGRLEEIPLPRLLLDLRRARFEGRVELGRQRVEYAFRFAAGAAVACEASAKKHDLCDQLVASGAISARDRDRAVSLVESKGCKEASALFELELLDARGLVGALRDQVRRRLIECMGWAKGAFTLDAGAPASEDTQPFQVDLYPLLQEGIAAHWRSDRVLLDLEPKIARFPFKNERFARVFEQLEADAALEAFAQALDGKQSLWSALKLASTPGALAAAWVLDAAGALEYRSESDTDEAELPPEIEIVFRDEPSREPQQQAGRSSASERDSKPAASAHASELRGEIASRFERLDELDHYQLLGVAADANHAAIKSSYRQAAKRYHPDALAKAGLDKKTRQQANKVFALISKAHAVLSNPRQRAEYDEELRSDASPIDATRLANAESLYRKGEILMRAGNFAGAIEFLRHAVELWPDESEYCSALGWALYRKLPSEPVLARQHLERAVELAPESAAAIHRLSVVVRSTGDAERADSLLERARAIDPKIG